MTTTTIQWTLRVGAIPTDATSAVLSDPTGTFGVRRVDTSAVVVADGTALAHVGVGVYRYTFTDPAPNLQYNYWVEFVYAGNTYRIEQDISGASAGGGPGTVIAPDIDTACVSLARYAELMEINANAFFGLNNGSGNEPCDHIWTEAERKRIARYLHEAQAEIEQVTGYPLCPTWFENEAQPYACPVHTRWTKVIQAGFENSVVIQAAAAVSYVIDPAIIGPIATTVTDTDEIRVYYPGSTRAIEPETVTIAGGNVTITVPWARLVDPAYFDNPADGWDYTDLSYYTPTVDVKQVYADDSIQAGLVWPHRATAGCDCADCCGTCGEYTETACMYIRNAETGAVDVTPAIYDGRTGWTGSCANCYCEQPSIIRLNYQAGLAEITAQMEEAVIRLAHAKMPYPPCGCDTLKDTWARDHKEIENPTLEQTMNPLGPYAGAWFAWRVANVAQTRRGLGLG